MEGQQRRDAKHIFTTMQLDKFKYLGSVLTPDSNVDTDVTTASILPGLNGNRYQKFFVKA